MVVTLMMTPLAMTKMRRDQHPNLVNFLIVRRGPLIPVPRSLGTRNPICFIRGRCWRVMHHHGHRRQKLPSSAPHEAFRPVPLRRIDRGRPPEEQTDTLFTGFERVYDPKRRLWCNERVGEERDCGAKREVARRQRPSGAARETAARQDSWGSDNQPAQVRRHTRREAAAQQERWRINERGAGTTREALVQRER